jgi:peroxiredoxin
MPNLSLEMNLLVGGDFRQCETCLSRVLIGSLHCLCATRRVKLGTVRQDDKLKTKVCQKKIRKFESAEKRRFRMQKRIPAAFAASFLAVVLLVASANPAAAQSKPAEAASMSMPKVGQVAPDFTLKYFDGKDLKDVSLSQYRGKKNVVLAFFIFAFTGG